MIDLISRIILFIYIVCVLVKSLEEKGGTAVISEIADMLVIFIFLKLFF
jgi:hypothetical protein